MTKPTLTTYGGDLADKGFPGQVADLNPATIESKTNSATGVIAFGQFVVRSSADDTCKAVAIDADKVIGVAVRHAIRPVYDASGNVGYQQYDSVPIMREGYVFALAAENAVRGDTAISITAGFGTIGSTTGGAAGTGRILMDGSAGNIEAVWETTTTAGQIGLLRVQG
jgi:hypothetical protein